MTTPIDALPLDILRQRGSSKWATHPEDVLPLFVAESDFPLAPAITAVLQRALDIGDTGYTPSAAAHPLNIAFVDFARRRWGWDVDVRRVRTTTDVVMGIAEILRAVTTPGDRVIVTPPIYPPFYDVIPEAGGVVDTVPLLFGGDGWTLDLPGIDAAFAAGARAMLLCNPHNPTGTVPSHTELAELARIARSHGAVVLSDEIHAPLTHDGATFVPFLSVSDDAAAVGYTITSASKTYNLAGLKTALMVTASNETTAVVDALPIEVEWRTGYFGVLAGAAAFSPDSDEWLEAVRARLAVNRALISELIAEHLPGATYREPDAGYLAWIDLSALTADADPAERILREARVAVNPGPSFGSQGDGHVRVNFATSEEILREAFARIGAVLHT